MMTSSITFLTRNDDVIHHFPNRYMEDMVLSRLGMHATFSLNSTYLQRLARGVDADGKVTPLWKDTWDAPCGGSVLTVGTPLHSTPLYSKHAHGVFVYFLCEILYEYRWLLVNLRPGHRDGHGWSKHSSIPPRVPLPLMLT